jgi:tetratricopeptide (TPR) repeat protein
VLTLLLTAGCALRPHPVPDPLSADEHNDLGVAYYAQGEAARAAREFERALALRPGLVRARVNLGDARLALGDVDGAIAAYEQARAAAADDPAIANNLAWALLQHPRRWPEAEPLIRGALATAPEPRGYYLDTLGVFLLRRGDPQEALAAFQAALADPGLRDAGVRSLVLRHAAEALERMGETGAAERCARLAETLAAPGKIVGAADTVC